MALVVVMEQATDQSELEGRARPTGRRVEKRFSRRAWDDQPEHPASEVIVDAIREGFGDAEMRLRALFSGLCPAHEPCDAVFTDLKTRRLIGVSGLPFAAPMTGDLLRDPLLSRWLQSVQTDLEAVLFRWRNPKVEIYGCRAGCASRLRAPRAVARIAGQRLRALEGWAGRLNERGEHLLDPSCPRPGPHHGVNLLLGNRVGAWRPLLTTPKSVVDALGRGSFRSHADRQVLATRWDLLAEENGFPANRQFYLVEGDRQIFYSGASSDSNLESIETVHGVNETRIRHRTRCGLEIERLIFILPSEGDEAPAVEAQVIAIRNHGRRSRELRLVHTGMFGPLFPDALKVDVLYTTLIQQTRLYRCPRRGILAVSPQYSNGVPRNDGWFHLSRVWNDGAEPGYPDAFCGSYGAFVGNGSLERPAGLAALPNRAERKGPGFFALSTPFRIGPGAVVEFDHLTGCHSRHRDGGFSQDELDRRIVDFVERSSNRCFIADARRKQVDFFARFAGGLQMTTPDETYNAYFNRNLPFQVLYQTFVSRSFDQTQKGFRQIGFREIQDLLASMPYWIGMGQRELVEEMIGEWASHVWRAGYADHQFYWEGIEPGDYSDDPLWLFQIVERFLDITGDVSFLDRAWPVRGAAAGEARPLYETLCAILDYTGRLSIGGHGLPLLDKADWNDTLKVDAHWMNGPAKERLHRDQLASGKIRPGESLATDYSESVMNACLLRKACRVMLRLAELRRDTGLAGELRVRDARLVEDVQRHAWKGDFFARVLFNRPMASGVAFLGAAGDGQGEDGAGSFFLNMFSWPILAGISDEEQIRRGLKVLRERLLTPHGLKLNTPVSFQSLGCPEASDVYFQGDRENCGVFKHANMMAVAAMLKAAREVRDRELAAELLELAYRIIDVVLPFRTLADPYRLAGNPRFCTQYNNSETGENIGPLLSGTSTWLLVSYFSCLGLEFENGGIRLAPLLRVEECRVDYALRMPETALRVRVEKPEGFRRTTDDAFTLELDGRRLESNLLSIPADGRAHETVLAFR